VAEKAEDGEVVANAGCEGERLDGSEKDEGTEPDEVGICRVLALLLDDSELDSVGSNGREGMGVAFGSGGGMGSPRAAATS
jgi:hypothetical protein